MSGLARIARVVLAAVPQLLSAQSTARDSIHVETLAPGVTWRHVFRHAGPLTINVVSVDLRNREYQFRQVRARDSLTGRERVTSMVARQPEGAVSVVAAINGDFFNLRTGGAESNQVIDGEWWKGLRAPDSPFDALGVVRTQFAIDGAGRFLFDQFAFEGTLVHRGGGFPLHTVNYKPHSGAEAVILFTERFGVTPRDTARVMAEAPLRRIANRADTGIYIRVGPIHRAGGTAIAAGTAVLAAYGPRANAVAQLMEGDTVRLLLRAVGRLSGTPIAPSLLIGGWPRILHAGKNVAARAPWEEATISSNAESRHPRSAIGFNRDTTRLFLMSVDGRQAASVGVTLVELADLMQQEGAWDALNFDGGGSTTLVVKGTVVNRPADVAGEREVGNALLIVRKPR